MTGATGQEIVLHELARTLRAILDCKQGDNLSMIITDANAALATYDIMESIKAQAAQKKAGAA